MERLERAAEIKDARDATGRQVAITQHEDTPMMAPELLDDFTHRGTIHDQPVFAPRSDILGCDLGSGHIPSPVDHHAVPARQDGGTATTAIDRDLDNPRLDRNGHALPG